MRNGDHKPTVFLDTTALMQYLRGGSAGSRLLSSPMLKRFHFAVNPVVLSEVLLASDINGYAKKLEKIQESVDILPINDAELRQLSDKLYLVHDRGLHTNEFLIYSSAVDCDYLVTEDDGFRNLADSEKPVILNTAEFLDQAEHP